MPFVVGAAHLTQPASCTCNRLSGVSACEDPGRPSSGEVSGPAAFFPPVRASSRPSGLPSSWTLGQLKDGWGGRGFEAVLWRHSAFCRRVQKHRGCPKSEVEACRGGEGAFLTSPCSSFSLNRDGCSITVYKSCLAKPVLCWRYLGHRTTASFPAKLRGLDSPRSPPPTPPSPARN